MTTVGALVGALVAVLLVPVLILAGFNLVKGLVWDA